MVPPRRDERVISNVAFWRLAVFRLERVEAGFPVANGTATDSAGKAACDPITDPGQPVRALPLPQFSRAVRIT